MNERSKKIAIATKDGIVVTEHFGHCREYIIAEVLGKKLNILEKRNVYPPCVEFEHKRQGIVQVIKRLQDCSHIVVTQIGLGALLILKEYDMEVVEYRGLIEELVNCNSLST